MKEAKLQKKIASILQGSDVAQRITNILIESGTLYKLMKNEIARALYEAKDDEDAFFNTYRPFGITAAQARKYSNFLARSAMITAKDLSDNKIEALAEAYAMREVDRYKESPTLALPLYMIAASLSLIGSYD